MAKKRYQRKKTLTVQLPCAAVTPDMAEQVRAEADELETSQSDVIRSALRLYFADKARKSSNELIIQENMAVKS